MRSVVYYSDATKNNQYGESSVKRASKFSSSRQTISSLAGFTAKLRPTYSSTRQRWFSKAKRRRQLSTLLNCLHLCRARGLHSRHKRTQALNTSLLVLRLALRSTRAFGPGRRTVSLTGSAILAFCFNRFTTSTCSWSPLSRALRQECSSWQHSSFLRARL